MTTQPSHLRYRAAAHIALLAALLSVMAPTIGAQEKVDTIAMNKLKDEGFKHSQVMNTMSWLTDVYGGRLTGSPNTKAAGDWAVKKLTEWGLVNAKLETWGPFGRGWTNERFVAQVTSPQPFPVIGYSNAWSTGLKAPVTADVVIARIDSAPDFAKYQGKLRGKIVLSGAPRDSLPPHFTADAHRYTPEELTAMAAPPSPPAEGRGGRGGRGGGRGGANFQAIQEFNRQRAQFWVDEGVVALVSPGRGDDGTVFVGGGGSRDVNAPPSVPQVTFAIEHYGRIYRVLEKGVPVTMELDVRNKFFDTDLNSFNVVAEIPGTDPRLKDEIVMLGAHFDSWHTGTGATDNAAGSAVMMEAVRLIKATGLKPRRTIRIGLWTGEEEGLLGSRAYVKEHFGDPATMQLKPDHAKFSSYFNVDNGTGAIRGVYEQGNEAVGPIFQAWMAPFKDKGVGSLTIRNTGGTDHLSFDAVGLPGFQFIQDPMDYGSRTHHSNMDTYERVQAEDMMHNAVIVAAFVYDAATRDEKLPRKPLPPVPATRSGQE